MQRVSGSSEFLLIQNPGHRIEAATAHFHRHVRGVQAGIDCLGLELAVKILAQHTGFLDLVLVRLQFVLHEFTRRFDDQLLFVSE